MTPRAWALLLVPLLAAPAPADESWVGKQVLFKKRPKEIQFGDVIGGKQVTFPFSGRMPVAVREDRGGRLRIQDGQREGWADKADFVPVQDAPAYFHQRVQADPKDTWALYMRGEGRLARGELDNAIKDFDECIRLDPTDAAAFNSRGLAWGGKTEYDRAIRDYDEAIRLDPKYARAFNNRGNAWSDKQQYAKAIRDYDAAIRLDGKEADPFYNRGLTWQKMGDEDKAIRDYDEAIRLNPNHALAFNNRGLAWRYKEEYDKAIRDYDAAIRLDPRLAIAFRNRGNARYRKKEYDTAIRDFDTATRLDPKDSVAYFNRGNSWYDKKEYDRAIKDFDEVIRLSPKAALPFYNRGKAWYYKNEYDRAIRDFDAAIRLDPKDARFLHSRSVALMLSRRPEAARGFQAAIDAGGYANANAPYAVIFGHFAARQAGDEASAQRFLKESAGKLGEAWPHPAVRFLRGEIDEAGLLKLATDNDQRTEARCYLGLDHMLKGRKDQALAHLRWVKEHGTATFTEYTLAVAELERLERDRKESER